VIGRGPQFVVDIERVDLILLVDAALRFPVAAKFPYLDRRDLQGRRLRKRCGGWQRRQKVTS
jgi:hypothetical protein